ncbi:type II toxin-antitoxin system RnlA family toxin [Fusibacter bizertensis]|uniref:Type II toxin-antitoxin system RnlA family toxin n=1 Tax=Fusibacter bizertensis TaxID=1488331 RepID=A0ABT6NEQ3_9FIRM|nr:type II toxin-antitoxin system RnlA family toxin [Fusibacter bizertensis]MDH8678872.1 type II toxin-antitoxin system RnlA family toxin [Fusibacter bizertensis]
MAKIHINPNDIEKIIREYSCMDSTFLLKSYLGNQKKYVCKFNLKGKECALDIFVTEKYVNILPKGKNIGECNTLIKHIEQSGYSATVKPKQFTMFCSKDILDLLEKHIYEDLKGSVSISKSSNVYTISGYNGDTVMLHYYPTKNNILIQGRPHQAYSVIMSFFASLPEYKIEDIILMGSQGRINEVHSSDVRKQMKDKLGEAYDYLDEALLKSISGSISMINQINQSEDYTGCLTGAFKALEGYLKKILSTGFDYKLKKSNTFSMFHEVNGFCDIDANSLIGLEQKNALKSLYKMYSNKRNVYLHSTIDPSYTRIIQEKKEAYDLLFEVLDLIRMTSVKLTGKDD